MSIETTVTLHGYLGGDVTLRRAGEVPVANFRVAHTPRRFDRATQEWSDGETQWYTVNAWRALAEHCDRSLRRGDPVFVHGRLRMRSYLNGNDVEVTVYEVEATLVGHDLNRGVSSFQRVGRSAGDTGEAPTTREADGAHGGSTQRADSEETSVTRAA